MINVMRVIDREKALNVARSLIYGNLNYGAEITPIQTPKTYKDIDRMIVQIIEDIYGWEPKSNNFTSNRKAFHEAGWINYRNLHHLCILRFLNRVLVNGVPNKLFENINKFFYWKEGEKCHKRVNFFSGLAEAERVLKVGEGKVQTMVIRDDEKNKDMTMFPYNAVGLFNELPKHVKVLIGTDGFSRAVETHFKSKCQHRINADVKTCKGCIENDILNTQVDIEYTGYGLQFDPVSFAAYRANARTNIDVGNMMNNINKSINASIKQNKTWKQLVQVENGWFEEVQQNKDNHTNRKRHNNF